MKNGQTVAAFERAFADYVGAKWAVALCNGTATLHTALVALGVKPGDRVAVPPLTMSATTIAVLHAGAVPVFMDVDKRTWLADLTTIGSARAHIPVSLYGLHQRWEGKNCVVDDAAQTLRPHSNNTAFTSYSFQASKILSLGEGGMLVTDDEELATRAREFSSLGYRMRADQPRIDPDALKSPTFDRHYSLGYNYRMNDLTAARGLMMLRDPVQVGPETYQTIADWAKADRLRCAALYRSAITGCDWLTLQHVPEGWTHDAWAFAVVCDTVACAISLQAKMHELGAEVPYGCWRVTYQEPAFRHLAPDGTCPIAEDLQPRILAFQTNTLSSAEQNAQALRRAIEEMS